MNSALDIFSKFTRNASVELEAKRAETIRQYKQKADADNARLEEVFLLGQLNNLRESKAVDKESKKQDSKEFNSDQFNAELRIYLGLEAEHKIVLAALANNYNEFKDSLRNVDWLSVYTTAVNDGVNLGTNDDQIDLLTILGLAVIEAGQQLPTEFNAVTEKWQKKHSDNVELYRKKAVIARYALVSFSQKNPHGCDVTEDQKAEYKRLKKASDAAAAAHDSAQHLKEGSIARDVNVEVLPPAIKSLALALIEPTKKAENADEAAKGSKKASEEAEELSKVKQNEIRTIEGRINEIQLKIKAVDEKDLQAKAKVAALQAQADKLNESLDEARQKLRALEQALDDSLRAKHVAEEQAKGAWRACEEFQKELAKQMHAITGIAAGDDSNFNENSTLKLTSGQLKQLASSQYDLRQIVGAFNEVGEHRFDSDHLRHWFALEGKRNSELDLALFGIEKKNMDNFKVLKSDADKLEKLYSDQADSRGDTAFVLDTEADKYLAGYFDLATKLANFKDQELALRLALELAYTGEKNEAVNTALADILGKVTDLRDEWLAALNDDVTNVPDFPRVIPIVYHAVSGIKKAQAEKAKASEATKNASDKNEPAQQIRKAHSAIIKHQKELFEMMEDIRNPEVFPAASDLVYGYEKTIELASIEKRNAHDADDVDAHDGNAMPSNSSSSTSSEASEEDNFLHTPVGNVLFTIYRKHVNADDEKRFRYEKSAPVERKL